MQNKLLAKYFIAGIIVLSLFSFAYVNLHSAYKSQAVCGNKMDVQHPELVEEEAQKRDFPVPDVTILSRIADIVQKMALIDR